MREREREKQRRGKGRSGERQKLPLPEGEEKEKELRLEAEDQPASVDRGGSGHDLSLKETEQIITLGIKHFKKIFLSHLYFIF